MCEKDIQELENSARVERSTINYLKENGSTIIDNYMNNISNINELYLENLKNEKIKSKFKKSLKRHFKWIKKHCKDDSIHLNNFRNFDTEEYDAYCNFYTYAKKYIKKDKSLHVSVQKDLKSYFKHLNHIYCSN